MPIEINGETYYTAAEAARYLGVSRDAFTRNVKPHLQPYKHGALRREYFRRSDLDEYRGIRPVEEDEQDQD
ncbi:MAG TPA: helix-turn-helix domain-containing protein [Ktedonobacteraceae bacterium]|nr:helix-turn-helix domain-containing protein [Ktedonobacteraceae bacterium]